MGELAEKMLDLAERPHSINEFNAAYNAVAKLEDDVETLGKRNAELADIAEALLDEFSRSATGLDAGLELYLPPRVVELRDLLLNPRASTDYVHVRDRDALLAAVSTIIGRSMRAIGAFQIAPSSAATATAIREALDRQPKIDGLHVVVMVPSQQSNPELLERASTMLAEAYIAATTTNPPAATAADGSVKP